jgi:hypothetical protein
MTLDEFRKERPAYTSKTAGSNFKAGWLGPVAVGVALVVGAFVAASYIVGPAEPDPFEGVITRLEEQVHTDPSSADLRVAVAGAYMKDQLRPDRPLRREDQRRSSRRLPLYRGSPRRRCGGRARRAGGLARRPGGWRLQDEGDHQVHAELGDFAGIHRDLLLLHPGAPHVSQRFACARNPHANGILEAPR